MPDDNDDRWHAPTVTATTRPSRDDDTRSKSWDYALLGILVVMHHGADRDRRRADLRHLTADPSRGRA